MKKIPFFAISKGTLLIEGIRVCIENFLNGNIELEPVELYYTTNSKSVCDHSKISYVEYSHLPEPLRGIFEHVFQAGNWNFEKLQLPQSDKI